MKKSPPKLGHLVGAFYLGAQSLAALVWWVLLIGSPEIRGYFRPSGTPDSALLAFWLPDLVVFIGAALVAAWRLVWAPQRARAPLWVYFGGSLYATLYCLAQTLLTGEAVLAVVFMLPSVLAGVVLLAMVGRR